MLEQPADRSRKRHETNLSQGQTDHPITKHILSGNTPEHIDA